MHKKQKVFLAVGGTGGHLVPAQQIAQFLERDKNEVFFIGSGLKKNPFFKKEGAKFFAIQSRSVQVKKPVQAGKNTFFIVIGWLQSLFFILKYKPDKVIGFGSYHTFPVLLAAKFLKIPIILYEPNQQSGKVNRFFFRTAKKILTPFSSSMKNVVTIPFFPWFMPEIVSKENSRKFLSLQQDLFTIFIFGGSQGAVFINEKFLQILPQLKEKRSFQVIHIIGKNENKEDIIKNYQKLEIPCYVKSFEEKMHLCYVASDLLICRSGAITIGEILTFEKPSLLIPYPFAMEDHQNINANFLVEKIQCAEKILQKECNETQFFQKIIKMLDEKYLKQLQENIQKFKKQKNPVNTNWYTDLLN